MKTAVVILNWNGKHLLEQFLPKVIACSPNAEVVVADNASSDDSVAMMRRTFPSVTIIENPSNNGYAGGYNEALAQVDADYYVLLNSDIEVTPNWIEPVIKHFESDPLVAAIQPKIRAFKQRNQFEYAGAAGGFIDKYGYPFCRGRIFETIEKDNGQYDDDCELLWASGACFFIRSGVYKELQGFDADFFAHQEEIDLCWRAFNKGYTIKYNHNSEVYHVGGATLEHTNPRKTYLNFRNSLVMLTKNLPKSSLFTILLVRLILDGVAGIRFILQGNFSHCWAVLQAHFSFYTLFLKNYNKRENLQSKAYYKTKSIVFSYYIKNGTIFGNVF